MQEVGLLQATVDAIGEADNEIGGFRQTRVRLLTEKAEGAPDTFTWGIGTLFCPQRNPVELAGLPLVRLDSDGRVFRVTEIVDAGGGDYEVEVDLGGETAPETIVQSLTGNATFNGTTTVTVVDPSEWVVGGWVISSTGQWFQIQDIVGSTLIVTNPHGLTIPSAATPAQMSPDPVLSIITEDLPVESVLNWLDAGSVAVDGVLYRYTSKTLSPMELKGLSYFDGGAEVFGLYQSHSLSAVVTDVTRDSSALELTRSAMLVDYADGDDLNALGRNQGVLRYPFLQSDDVFREIIKALAYNPRGTMFGLELALDALVGEGNYELYEDLVNHPATVFVQLLNDAALEDRSTGKAFLTGAEAVDPTTTTSVPITGDVITRGTVYSVRLKDHHHDGDFRNTKPSGLSIRDIQGSPVQAWLYSGSAGSTEGANVILTPGLGIRISHTAGGISRYQADRRFADAYSDWSVDCMMSIPSAATLSTPSAFALQWSVRVLNGDNEVGWGCWQNSKDSGKFWLAMISGSLVPGNEISLNKDVDYAVQLRKRGGRNGHVELWIDGNLWERLPYSDFLSATGGRLIAFGINLSGAPTTVYGDLRQLSFRIRTPSYDYWNLYHEAATLGAPNTIQIVTAEFLAGDVGKRIETLSSGITNPYGGNNNGKFVVSAFSDTNNIEVAGVEQVDAAAVETVNPLRITVDSRKQQFVFPDDLGKEIVLLDSAQGNNGTYVIEKLLNSDFDDLAADFATPLRTVTNVCEIEEPVPSFAFVSETQISFRLDPVFAAEGSMEFVLSDAGSESGGVLTLREALPSADTIVDVWYNEVLSALVLLDFSVKNEIVQLLPDILWQYYPFYLSDPLGFVRAYLDDITAAGVIPEYFVE